MAGTADRAPYGRRNVVHADFPDGRRRRREEGDGRTFGPYEGESYYGHPAVKHSHYRWLIASYFFVGGLAGAAQVIATIADLLGSERDRTTVRCARYLALAGAMLSPVFLIADLHTRHRWYNMLRIFRRTSPMSIGSWTLAVFGTFSGLAAFGQGLEDILGLGIGRAAATIFGLPAAAAGVVMSYYTGILLTATSTPLWASAARLLPAIFATSAMSTATAAVALAGDVAGAPRGARQRLEKIALVAGGAELALSLAADHNWRRHGLAKPLDEPPISTAYRYGVFGLAISLPLVIDLWQLVTGSSSRWLSALAALSALTGGFVQRSVVLFAGNESSLRPQDYLTFTQPNGSSLLDDAALPDLVAPTADSVKGGAA